jgi:hypothetical protein
MQAGAFWQPLSGSHTKPATSQVPGVWLHWPPLHWSFVQATLSSHSAALQHEPQVAVLPSALGQHSWPSPHNLTTLHWPSVHEPTVQGSLSVSHCESLQQAAQPLPSQHSEAFGSLQNLCSQKLSTHESTVQSLLSAHTSAASPAKTPHTCLARQPSLAEQYWAGSHFVSSGTYMHCPEKQVGLVQLAPAVQSLSSQHSAQSPPQHFSVPAHLGAVSQVPSALHRSTVHGSLSLQSSGPAQCALLLAPLPSPAALPESPPLPVLPAVPLPAMSPLAVNAAPEQPLVQSAGKQAPHKASSRNLGLKKLTAILLGKGKGRGPP